MYDILVERRNAVFSELKVVIHKMTKSEIWPSCGGAGTKYNENKQRRVKLELTRFQMKW